MQLFLGSGEEGKFPELLQRAETRLTQVAPDSHVLRTEEPALTKSMLEPEQWDSVAREIEEWTDSMKTRDQKLKESSSDSQLALEMPPVREAKINKTEPSLSDKQEPGPSKVKRAAPRNYSDWDKFDVDKELLKMELEEERRKEQAIKKKKQQEKEEKKKDNKKEETPVTGNLSATEKEFMATNEKDRGNEYFRSGDYEQAVKHYSTSIALCPTPAAYNNRAIAHLKLHNYNAALADCNQVLEAEPLNVKALLRRGIAHQNKKSYEQAFEDFSKVMELEPENRLAKSLAEQMKTKCEPSVKSVRMTIEDEPTGFVFPAALPNVPVNEWGLAKIMCKCSGTPSWARRTPPKCKTCLRKRAERRAKREEERRNIEASSFPCEGDSTTSDSNPSQMQTDEKGSGDMRATEKVTNEVGNDLSTGVRSGEMMEEEGANKLMCRNDRTALSDDSNIVMEEQAKGVSEAVENDLEKIAPENKQEIVAERQEKNEDTKRTRKVPSPEVNKSKNTREKVSPTNRNSENKQIKCALEASTIREESAVPDLDSGSEKTRVKVASKYKKNVKSERQPQSCHDSESDVLCCGNSDVSITSPYEFMRAWQALKKDVNLSSHAQVLRAVPPADLPSVVGNKLDGSMLSTILICLEKHFNPEQVLDYLNHLVQVPRFSVVSMFLEPSEKQAMCQLLEKLKSLGHHPSDEVWKAFSC
ncbi:RNA polymerase II-associated protein 3 isoform X2 [Periplaneta americana]|uniref:RNA polymerase II-associated protein 3 isoform X2 n=1 Tax=Periplaneta americana TaxID=6978 RepID=UPI0037E7E23C